MDKEFKELIRLGDADIKGIKPVYYALRKIKGISYSFSNLVCNFLKIDKNVKIGDLDDDKLKQIEDLIKNPKKYNISSWLLNRRKDYDTGEDQHLISTDLNFRKEFDIKRMRMIKCYRGIRHTYGLPVRGQRTRRHFSKGKTVGVKRKTGAKKGRT